MGARREDHIGQLLDDALEFGIGIDGVLPDLIGLRCQVYLGIGLAIQDTRLLVVEIDQRLRIRLIFKEGFVGADHFGILLQPRAHALAQADEAFHALGWQEGVAIDGI